MVDNFVKPLGLVLIATAHMVFNGQSKAEVTGTVGLTGTLGSNITLIFTFNIAVNANSHIAIYTSGEKKIAECRNCTGNGVIIPKNYSVMYHITNLTQNPSETYWASVFIDNYPTESSKVQLDVREKKTSTTSATVPPMPTNNTINENSGSSSFFSFHVVTVLVVSPVVLLAALLPCLIWCLLRTKEKQQQQSSTQHNSNPTIQETIDNSINVPPPSLIYSVLDFPKRCSTVVEINPNDTEYAAVSYFTENPAHS
ncbi:hypothetical protein Q5P01_015848 [Channa striata]|uniref:Uncharacterized protein n=1 Tax=Channa striata TaxID=64152 RepID=A0AA88MCD6_CHASR|nr:hypothetical protein Q5P01_015848 [Channa striata]